MSVLLKDLYYSANSYLNLAEDLHKIYPKFSVSEFYKDSISNLEQLELKQRITHTAEICHKYLPQNYNQAIEILSEYVKGRSNNFYYIFLPEYVARYGKEYFSESMEALKNFTQYSSSEEAIRHFFVQDFAKTMNYMQKWAEDENYHVRRLSSEGSRPRLPWAIQLKQIIENPDLTLPIIEKLKNDPVKYVQKSVANHLNDISKDNPKWLLNEIRTWNQDHDATYWIIKHGTRTLIKQGNKDALKLLGFDSEINIDLQDLTLNSPIISFDDDLKFTSTIRSSSCEKQNLVIDYRIYFMKKNGKQIAKTFKLSNKTLEANEVINLSGKYSFTQKTTRKHYPGKHKIELLINGNIVAQQEFHLKD